MSKRSQNRDAIAQRLLGGSQSFRKNFLTIASASFISQGLNIAALPALSRLYSAEAFGLLTTFLTLHGIALSITTWRVDWFIPNTEDRKQAEAVFLAGIVISCVMTIFFATAFIAGRDIASVVLQLSASSVIWVLLPIGLLFASIQVLLQAWYVFTGDVSTTGHAKLSQTGVTLSVSAAIGFIVGGGDGLLWGYLAGLIAAVLTLLAADRPALILNPERVTAAFEMLSRYRRQLVAAAALGVVNVIMTMMMSLLIVWYYGQEIVGWYGLVFRAATGPISLITLALVHSFWSDAAKLARSDTRALRRFYLGAVKRLGVVALFVAIASLLGPYYVPFVFGGDEWHGAGVLLAATTPWLIGIVIFSPTTHLVVYNKTHWQLACDFVTAVFAGGTFVLIATHGGQAWLAIAACSSILLLGYIVRFVLHLVANARHVPHPVATGINSAGEA